MKDVMKSGESLRMIDLAIAQALDAVRFSHLAWKDYGVCPQGHEEKMNKAGARTLCGRCSYLAYWEDRPAGALSDEWWDAYVQEFLQKQQDPLFHPDWEVTPYPQSFSTSLDRIVNAIQALGLAWWYDAVSWKDENGDFAVECGVLRIGRGPYPKIVGIEMVQGNGVEEIAQALAKATVEVLTSERGWESPQGK